MTSINRYTPEMIASFVRDGHWTPDRTVDFWLRNAGLQPDALALQDDGESYSWADGVRAIDAVRQA